MANIHTLEFQRKISKEDGEELVNHLLSIVDEEGKHCCYYNQKKNCYVVNRFVNNGLRIELCRRKNDIMSKEYTLVYVVNLQEVLSPGIMDIAFSGTEVEMQEIIEAIDKMLEELDLPYACKKDLFRIDLCIDLPYRTEMEVELAMRLIRRHGVPVGYVNFYLGKSGCNNQYSFELERINSKERLVFYNKSHQLKQFGVEDVDPLLRVEYKMRRNMLKSIDVMGMDLIDVIFLWKNHAELLLQERLNEVLLSGNHFKYDEVMRRVKKFLSYGKLKMTIRNQHLYDDIGAFLNRLRTDNDYYKTVGDYKRERSHNAERLQTMLSVLYELGINPIVIAQDSKIGEFQGVKERISVDTGWNIS